MKSVAIGIILKTPKAGASKTRLSPPLALEECARLSACFIADLASTIDSLSHSTNVEGYAVYTPEGSERDLQPILPASFGLVLQGNGDLGDRLNKGIEDLLAHGHAAAVLVNSDSPTLPVHILADAAAILANGERDVVAISPAIDGGYTFIGLTRPHPELFRDIPWSTDVVFALTLERAKAIGVEVVVLEPWYDVDDAGSLAMLEAELAGIRPDFSTRDHPLEPAPRTESFLESLRMRQVAG